MWLLNILKMNSQSENNLLIADNDEEAEALHRVTDQIIKGLRKEFGSQDEVDKIMKAHKIRPRDLDMRTIEDFMDGESARIWEARYTYFNKKKKVKVEILRKILKQQRKQNQEQAVAMRQREFERERNSQASPQSYQQENINRQNSTNVFMTLVKTESDQLNCDTKRSNASSELRDNAPDELVSKKKQELIKRNQGVLARIQNLQKSASSHTLTTTTGALLNLADLVVNKEPEIELACELDCVKAENLCEQMQEQKIKYLEKMTHAKDKLDSLMAEDEKKMNKKMKVEEKKQQKLLQHFLEEDYERQQLYEKERGKASQARSKQLKTQRDIERQQIQEYKRALVDNERRHHEQQMLQRELSEQRFNKLKAQIDREQETAKKRQDEERRQYLEAQERLQEMDARWKVIKEFQSAQLLNKRSSRNQASSRLDRIHTENYKELEKSHLLKLNESLLRYSKVDVKRENASLERKELSEMKMRENDTRYFAKVQNRTLIQIQREKWSKSVLEKHKKHSNQVTERYKYEGDTVKVKREFFTLKKEDQTLNYLENVHDFKDNLNRINLKHAQLTQQNMKTKLKLEKLQQKQRAIEIKKKNEIYKDKFYQSLKPRNRVGDLLYKKELENPTQIIRAKGIDLNNIEIRRQGTDGTDSEDENDPYKMYY